MKSKRAGRLTTIKRNFGAGVHLTETELKALGWKEGDVVTVRVGKTERGHPRVTITLYMES